MKKLGILILLLLPVAYLVYSMEGPSGGQAGDVDIETEMPSFFLQPQTTVKYQPKSLADIALQVLMPKFVDDLDTITQDINEKNFDEVVKEANDYLNNFPPKQIEQIKDAFVDKYSSKLIEKTVKVFEAGRLSSGVTKAISTDGKKIVSGSKDGTIRIWDMATGKQIGQPLFIRKPPFTGPSAVNSVAMSPDGTKIVSSYANNKIRIWDIEPTFEEVLKYRAKLNSEQESQRGTKRERPSALQERPEKRPRGKEAE